MKRKSLSLVCVFGAIILSHPQIAGARVNSLSGSISLEQEYDSNIFRVDDDEEDQWTTTLTPQLILRSEGEKDTISLTAGSDLLWDQRRDVREFEHTLSMSGSKELFRHFRINVSDDYNYNDNSPRADLDPSLSLTTRFSRAGEYERMEVARLLFPEISYTPDDYLRVLTELQDRYDQADPATRAEVERYLSNSPDDGRRRYWENTITLGTEYEFAQDSVLTVGYEYRTLDDRSADITEYYEHSPNLGLSYRFNPQWFASVNYEFTKGQYDESDDLRGHDTEVMVDYSLSQSDTLSFVYGYDSSSYEGEREDSTQQDGEIGWRHGFTPHTNMSANFGVNYLDRGVSPDQRGGSVDVRMTHALRYGSIDFGIEGTADKQADGGGWEDLSRSITLDGGISYVLQEDLTANLDLSYEKRYQWLINDEKTSFDDYEAGLSVTYSYWRWFGLTLSYTYNRLEGHNTIISDYEEHVISLALSANKELLRW